MLLIHYTFLSITHFTKSPYHAAQIFSKCHFSDFFRTHPIPKSEIEGKSQRRLFSLSDADLCLVHTGRKNRGFPLSVVIGV